MIPHRIQVESGDVFIISLVNGGVMLTGPQAARLSRSDAEALGDALYIVSHELRRAKPITSVEDGRVKG